MERIVHDLIQGTSEWDAFRMQHHGASEAGAMLGVSRKVKRNELLRMKKLCIAKEFSEWVQTHVLDHGHQVEDMARPLVEEIIGDTLYPATYSMGKLSASCDGITMDDILAFEHKQWNEEYGALVRSGEVPEEHKPQCQQVLLVTGAERLIFVVSDGTLEKFAYVWVYPDAEYQARIVAGWEQFDRDLEAYVDEPKAAPVVAKQMESLPAVFIQCRGEVAIQDNLGAYRERLQAFVADINMKPEDDQGFADLDAASKKLRDAEDALKKAKAAVIAQIDNVGKVTAILDDMAALANTTAIAAEKAFKQEKENRKTAILAKGRESLQAFIDALEHRAFLPIVTPNFSGVTKNLRSLDSYKNAVDTEVARVKIEVQSLHNDIAKNLSVINADPQYAALFADLQTLALREPDFVSLTVKNRIAEHQAAEQARLEAERERIRAEEEAKATEAAQAQLQAHQDATARAEQVERDAALERAEPRQTFAFPGHPDYPRPDHAAPVTQRISAALPVTPVHQVEDTGARITIGQINERIAPLSISQTGLNQLGIESVGKERAAVLYRASDMPRIFSALINHLSAAANIKQAA